MGDMVGVHEPHATIAKTLISKALSEAGVDPAKTDQIMLQGLANLISTLDHKTPTEAQIRKLIAEDAFCKKTWAILITPPVTPS